MELEALREKMTGQVLTGDSEGYDEARLNWQLTQVQWPKIIVVPETEDDIREAVLFAGENGLKIGVKNTGHGPALPVNDNMLIVVSSLKDVRIDPDRRTARFQAGAMWADILEKAQDVGLAPLLGSSSHIGAVGYTLGGGMGWLARKYGFAFDSVESMELVTPKGEVLKASRDVNPDIFWAMKGCGAAFGIVTAMELKLFPVETVYAGALMYPPEAAGEVLLRYRDWSNRLSDDWTTSVAIENYPDLPIVPEHLRGKSAVLVRGCFDGPPEKGEEEIRQWLAWKEPVQNLFRPLPFRQSDMISMDPKDPLPAALNNIVLRELSEKVIETLVERAVAGNGPTPLLKAEIHQGGGVMSKSDRAASAFSQQDAPYFLKLIGVIPFPEMKKHYDRIVGEIKEELRPYSTGGVYLNFLAGEEKWNCARHAYSPAALEKLTRLKKEHDPENLLSFSMNLS